MHKPSVCKYAYKHSDMRTMWYRCEIYVISMWHCCGVVVNMMWHCRECDVRSVWNRCNIVVKPLRNLCEILVKSLWNHGDVLLTIPMYYSVSRPTRPPGNIHRLLKKTYAPTKFNEIYLCVPLKQNPMNLNSPNLISLWIPKSEAWEQNKSLRFV